MIPIKAGGGGLDHTRGCHSFPSGAGGYDQAFIGRARFSAANFYRAAKVMDETQDDFADRVGRRVATVFIVLLAAMFAYGYLGLLI